LSAERRDQIEAAAAREMDGGWRNRWRRTPVGRKRRSRRRAGAGTFAEGGGQRVPALVVRGGGRVRLACGAALSSPAGCAASLMAAARAATRSTDEPEKVREVSG